MKIKIVFFAAVLLITSLIVPGTGMASENVLSKQVEGDIQPSGETTQETSALRRLAIALASGRQAMRSFRASQSPVAQTCGGGFATVAPGEIQNVYLDTHLHGLPCATGQSENNDNKDKVNPPIAGMECYIDRIASYLSCYSSRTDAEEAGTLFTRLVDELQAALPSDRWKGMNKEPGMPSIRSYTYVDQGSNAHIDIDIIVHPELGGQSSYIVSIFGWTD